MPRLQVYLPDDLHEELKRRGLPASELLQIALGDELERQDALDETATYLEELAARSANPPPGNAPTPTRSPDEYASGASARPADVLILDSGGVTRLSARSKPALELIRSFVDEGLWPPIVPTMVLVEAFQGDPARDAHADRFLKTCIIHSEITPEIARRDRTDRRQR